MPGQRGWCPPCPIWKPYSPSKLPGPFGSSNLFLDLWSSPFIGISFKKESWFVPGCSCWKGIPIFLSKFLFLPQVPFHASMFQGIPSSNARLAVPSRLPRPFSICALCATKTETIKRTGRQLAQGGPVAGAWARPGRDDFSDDGVVRGSEGVRE